MKIGRWGIALLLAASFLRPQAAQAAPMPFSGPAVDAERLAVTDAGGLLQVYDEVTLANPGRTALRRIRLPLPRGAQGVRLVAGFAGPPAAVASDMLTAPVNVPAAGHTGLVFTYAIAARSLPITLERAITLPTARLEVLVRAGQLEVRSAQLLDIGEQRLNGVAVRGYAAEGLAPGETLSLRLESPSPWLDRLAGWFGAPVWMGLAAALLVGLLITALRRESGAGGASPSGAPDP